MIGKKWLYWMNENCLVLIRAHATPRKRLFSDWANSCILLAIVFRYFSFFSFGQLSGILSEGEGRVDRDISVS